MTEAEQIEQIGKWLIAGNRDLDILAAIRTHWPGADVERLVGTAVANLADAGNFDPRTVRGWCFEATKDLYRQMTAIGDFAGALRAVLAIWDRLPDDNPEEPPPPEGSETPA